MKSTAFAAAIALLAAAFTVGASAQTGAPSAQEVGHPTAVAQSAPVNVADADVGSYARYLMLNGATQDVAVKAAQNIDHPSAHRFAWHRARVTTPAVTTETTTQQ